MAKGVGDAAETLDLIGELFEQDFFLTRVLELLIDDGLHECRRVCRRWLEFSEKLPLKCNCRDWKTIPTFIRKFPNAVSLLLSHASPLSPADAEENFSSAEALLKNLARWRDLRNLEMCITGEKAAAKPFASMFASVRNLRSMSLIFYGAAIVDVAQLGQSLQQLTKLTMLKLFVIGSKERTMEPLQTMSCIEDLEANLDLLVDKTGKLFFPALTHLTKLAVHTLADYEKVVQPKGGLLKALERYASTLVSLEVRIEEDYLFMGEMSRLMQFPKLRSFNFLLSRRLQKEFYAIARNMTYLTQLRVGRVELRAPRVKQSILCLTNLETLSICNKESFTSRTIGSNNLPVSRLRAMTKLTFCDVKPDMLSPLTNLVDLSIGQNEYVELLLLADLCDDIYISSRTLFNLKKLEKLTIFKLKVDNDLFSTLGELQHLTYLNFSSLRNVNEDSVFPTVNQVTKLLSLTIGSHSRAHKPCEYLKQGKLTRLRYLYMWCYPSAKSADASIDKKLYKALPCLRHVGEPT